MKNFLLYIILLLIVISCKKTINDSEKPKVITFFINTTAATPGGQITLQADISDNNLLKSYKISVIDNFGFTADSIEETVRLSDVLVKEIDNRQLYTINDYSLPIPLNTSAGPYTIKLSVLDEKGNESIEKTQSFEITNTPNQPTINITNPTSSSSYNQGDTIYMAGNTQDNVALRNVKIQCSNTTSTFYNTTFILDTVLNTSFDFSTDGNIKIPLPAVTGSYTLQTSTTDTVGNLKVVTTNFTVN